MEAVWIIFAWWVSREEAGDLGIGSMNERKMVTGERWERAGHGG